MSLITTDNGRIVFKKAESVMLVPYAYNSTHNVYVLDALYSEVFDISAVIGDSIVIEQSDGNTEAKYNEFNTTPLVENMSGTKYNFTAQCLDLQNKVLMSAFGAMIPPYWNAPYDNDFKGLAALQADFVTMYALVRIRFKDRSVPDVFLPKVQLNSKMLISQLKTRAGQGNIAGTANPTKIAIDRGENKWLVQFSDRTVRTSRYCPNTPVLFVPREKTPFFFAWGKDEEENGVVWDRYSTIDFENGVVEHNIQVDERLGNWRGL